MATGASGISLGRPQGSPPTATGLAVTSRTAANHQDPASSQEALTSWSMIESGDTTAARRPRGNSIRTARGRPATLTTGSRRRLHQTTRRQAAADAKAERWLLLVGMRGAVGSPAGAAAHVARRRVGGTRGREDADALSRQAPVGPRDCGDVGPLAEDVGAA